MSDVGITNISVYVPQYYIAHSDLAIARDISPEKFTIGLGNDNMAIIPNYEDTVTMAANAAQNLLDKTDTDPNDIQQMVVSTETGVDYSKPVASYCQDLLNIGTRCRVFEIKHACYGGTAGLINSVDRISRNFKNATRALVIMTDIARYGFNTPGEPTQGAGAVALLVENNPKLLSIDTSLNGLYSKNVFDFWRPSGHNVPIVDGKYSIECYLTALEGALEHLRSNLGLKEKDKLFDVIDYLIYHMPYCNMAKKGHKRLVEMEYKELGEDEIEKKYNESFKEMVEPSLLGIKEVGNIYTGAVYLGLMSLLENKGEKIAGKKVGIFSYGSGCGAEFFICDIKEDIGDIIKQFDLKKQIDRRKKICIDHYTHIYSKDISDVKYFPAEVENFQDEYTQFVFKGIKNHQRQYAR